MKWSNKFGITIYFHYGINIGTIKIENQKKKDILQEDYKHYAHVGAIQKRIKVSN
jgi:hypothetical protein